MMINMTNRSLVLVKRFDEETRIDTIRGLDIRINTFRISGGKYCGTYGYEVTIDKMNLATMRNSGFLNPARAYSEVMHAFYKK